jgi:hypothetical protein
VGGRGRIREGTELRRERCGSDMTGRGAPLVAQILHRVSSDERSRSLRDFWHWEFAMHFLLKIPINQTAKARMCVACPSEERSRWPLMLEEGYLHYQARLM